ncbi:hypothetical protein GCM10022393_21250 [Aquimarina addita]|uniref:Lipoprotein n=1 Tax=Aquimarina addita TaxID=870485 RepID=A0ABP6ULH8_9FLAO
MKNLTNLIKPYLVIAFALILATSCKEAGQTTTISPELDEYKKKIEGYEKEITELKELLDLEKNRKEPTNIIQSDFAKEIYHQYDERAALINKVVGTDGNGNPFNATRYLSYDLDQLKSYIKYIESKSRKAGVKPTGVNFYFALYPKDYVRDDKKDYAKRQTFFVAPTYSKTDDGETAHIAYTLDNDFKIVDLHKLLEVRIAAQKAGFFSSSASLIEDNSLVGNELGGSPPMDK